MIKIFKLYANINFAHVHLHEITVMLLSLKSKLLLPLVMDLVPVIV